MSISRIKKMAKPRTRQIWRFLKVNRVQWNTWALQQHVWGGIFQWSLSWSVTCSSPYWKPYSHYSLGKSFCWNGHHLPTNECHSSLDHFVKHMYLIFLSYLSPTSSSWNERVFLGLCFVFYCIQLWIMPMRIRFIFALSHLLYQLVGWNVEV